MIGEPLVTMPLPAHLITGSFNSPIPLWVFVLAAGVTILATALRPTTHQAPEAYAAQLTEPRRVLPAPLVRLLAILGPLAALWVALQGLLGGSSVGRVDVLFLWHVGWVALPALAAAGISIYPIVDPWRRLALLLRPRAPRQLPADDVAPASTGVFAVATIIVLELVLTGGRGGPSLFAALLLHGTWVVTGRLTAADPERWAARHDPLTIVSRLLGEISRRRPVGDPDDALVAPRQSAPDGGARSRFALVCILVGAVIYDGVSQTEIWFRIFGLPAIPARAALLGAVIALIALLSFVAARVATRTNEQGSLARAAVVAGLRPVALGYLIAHYGPSVIAAAPYWLVAIADPLQRGWNLFGLAYTASDIEPLPGAVIWAGQVAAVVGGHIAGIRAAGRAHPAGEGHQIATALLLVSLTMITLWTLGQAVVTN